MSRGVGSQLDAVFAMPGLEEIAEPLYEFVAKPQHAVAVLGYCAARSVLAPNALDEELSDPRVWGRIRDVAASQCRDLPVNPPTFNKLHHLRRRIDQASVGSRDRFEEVLVEMNNRFIEESVKLAKAGGLLDPAKVGDLLQPVRSNTVYADGTWWKAHSGVTCDPVTGELRGVSRSRGVQHADGSWWTEPVQVFDERTGEVFSIEAKRVQGPRVAEVRSTSKDGRLLTGIPVVMVGVHGETNDERVVLGLRRFVSPLLSSSVGEAPAADELLARVIDVAGDGVRWCVYDMAFEGANLRRLARRGVVGIAAMRSASKDQRALETINGGPIRFNNDARKVRFAVGAIKNVRHYVDGRWCEHALTSVDGAMRCHDLGTEVTPKDPLCEPVELNFTPDRRGTHRMHVSFEVPCVNQSMRITLDLTGKIEGTNVDMLNRVRPISEYSATFAAAKGYRQDVENLNSIMKRVTPLDGRATSLAPAHFELDLIGAALWVNSKFWDIHIARVSRSAQERELREANRLINAVPL